MSFSASSPAKRKSLSAAEHAATEPDLDDDLRLGRRQKRRLDDAFRSLSINQDSLLRHARKTTLTASPSRSSSTITDDRLSSRSLSKPSEEIDPAAIQGTPLASDIDEQGDGVKYEFARPAKARSETSSDYFPEPSYRVHLPAKGFTSSPLDPRLVRDHNILPTYILSKGRGDELVRYAGPANDVVAMRHDPAVLLRHVLPQLKQHEPAVFGDVEEPTSPPLRTQTTLEDLLEDEGEWARGGEWDDPASRFEELPSDYSYTSDEMRTIQRQQSDSPEVSDADVEEHVPNGMIDHWTINADAYQVADHNDTDDDSGIMADDEAIEHAHALYHAQEADADMDMVID
ncbi:hypothetical protein PYCC9005_003007 [Savitreella phatthalungensis]